MFVFCIFLVSDYSETHISLFLWTLSYSNEKRKSLSVAYGNAGSESFHAQYGMSEASPCMCHIVTSEVPYGMSEASPCVRALAVPPKEL
jgi:hypothetical protein